MLCTLHFQNQVRCQITQNLLFLLLLMFSKWRPCLDKQTVPL